MGDVELGAIRGGGGGRSSFGSALIEVEFVHCRGNDIYTVLCCFVLVVKTQQHNRKL